MPNQTQNTNGEWVDSKPIPYKGWKAKLEQWFMTRGYLKIGRLLARWDEKGLGK